MFDQSPNSFEKVASSSADKNSEAGASLETVPTVNPETDSGNSSEISPAAKLQGYKRASIVVKIDSGTGQLLAGGFQAHTHKALYLADDAAVCSRGLDHQPPQQGCRCGFYALKDRTKIDMHRFQGAQQISSCGSSAILDVELYGSEVMEGKAGYRATRQRVTSVALAGNCKQCDEPADITVQGSRYTGGLATNLYWIESSCAQCANKTGKTRFTLAELSSILETETRFDKPQAAAVQKVADATNAATMSVAMMLLVTLSVSDQFGGPPLILLLFMIGGVGLAAVRLGGAMMRKRVRHGHKIRRIPQMLAVLIIGALIGSLFLTAGPSNNTDTENDGNNLDVPIVRIQGETV